MTTPTHLARAYRWWLPHFDKLHEHDQERLAKLAERVNQRSRELNGTEPANTVQLLEALCLVLTKDLDQLDRRAWEALVKAEGLETEAVLRDVAGRLSIDRQ